MRSSLAFGMDVDWARTERGIREFDPLVVRDFKAKGLTHVRIRVAGAPTEARLIHLRKLVEACEYYGVIPIIAYQADAYKTDPSASHEKGADQLVERGRALFWSDIPASGVRSHL
ncbi:Endoglucanase D Endo-1,4-beta-glucanase D; Cellulase D; EGCCD; Flags: Precursor [Salmonella enterica subsp. enterica]|uniref:Uncharacterized protein n=1 Tax=Salmonella enterica I TaxID=59201 RepID=A0A379VH91_SALET|nr:Endoglucanase D Endo-1,4-beta-glucanase D; Cellulase D; EGCCD; Flags: Precursor [Salmonella enterica subsp. enterica]